MCSYDNILFSILPKSGNAVKFGNIEGENKLKCDICGKTPQFGHLVSHSKRRTNHMWMPNIQSSTIIVNGAPKKANLCTRCIRTQSKEARKLEAKAG